MAHLSNRSLVLGLTPPRGLRCELGTHLERQTGGGLSPFLKLGPHQNMHGRRELGLHMEREGRFRLGHSRNCRGGVGLAPSSNVRGTVGLAPSRSYSGVGGLASPAAGEKATLEPDTLLT